MTEPMSKRTQAPLLDVCLLREGIVESRHHAHAVVCDARGEFLPLQETLKPLLLSALPSSPFKPWQ